MDSVPPFSSCSSVDVHSLVPHTGVFTYFCGRPLRLYHHTKYEHAVPGTYVPRYTTVVYVVHVESSIQYLPYGITAAAVSTSTLLTALQIVFLCRSFVTTESCVYHEKKKKKNSTPLTRCVCYNIHTSTEYISSGRKKSNGSFNVKQLTLPLLYFDISIICTHTKKSMLSLPTHKGCT